MDFRAFLKDNNVILDGGMGTLLQNAGLPVGELPERWCVTHPETVTDIHKSYFDAGSNVVNTNTFGANCLKFDEEELESIISSAIKCVDRARERSKTEQPKFIALDIGPTGKLLKPYGDLDFEEAVEIFAKTVRLGVKHGAELVTVETMNDSYETKAALLAVKENCDLPVIVTNAYGEDGKLMTGASPEAMVSMLEGMGADVIGVNCSLGPKQLSSIVDKYLRWSSIPVAVKPNAGLPQVKGGKTVYDVSPSEFAEDVSAMMKKGVRVVGGCCGTTPEYISELSNKVKEIGVSPIAEKNITAVSSYTHAVKFGNEPILIGERINPTGKKKLKEALREGDMDYILSEALGQESHGVHVLDVNAGLPEIDERAALERLICEIQAVTALPLQIDTSNTEAMEAALRRYNGKAMINSVSGKEESIRTVMPLAKKYGGVLVALTLDESGIPETAEGRVAIAKKILSAAEGYGIRKSDIIFDPLAMTVSAEPRAAVETLRAVRMIKEELSCQVSLGVSNVSFGLPARDLVNSTFFAQALECGLSAAIINPYSAEMLKAYYTHRVLHGMDENCAEYISFAQRCTASELNCGSTEKAEDSADGLTDAICKGLVKQAASVTAQLLATEKPLDIVQNKIIPALDEVGRGFEKKTIYLPSLLMAAEAAKAAFSEIKAVMSESSEKNSKGIKIVLATVHGDIHDIGKNIVRLLLENYGYDVTDLGRDVPPEVIVDKALELDATLVGLSALMTTTVPAMEQTIKLLREKAPKCKIAVGGAVLTQEYADRIGADAYCKDAMQTVRYAETL